MRTKYAVATTGTLAIVMMAALVMTSGFALAKRPEVAPPDPPAGVAQNIKTFCDYGYAFTENLSATSGDWEQVWGLRSVDWFECTASPNNSLLNRNVSGKLESEAIAFPYFPYNPGFGTSEDSGEYTLVVPLAGTLTLSGPGKSGHLVLGSVGVYNFVVDGNADAATVDKDAGTIKIPFGRAAYPDSSPMRMTIEEASGRYETIKQVGEWEFYVSGEITLARIPYLSVQDNILAALIIPGLIVWAEEEMVLTGKYYLGPPNK